MSIETNDDFQKELIDLFIQEAHEWLQQIHVALDELQQSPAPDRHSKLVDTIKGGITNLGGSAATINLHEVEEATFAAIPFIEAVQNPGASISVNEFLALCKHLGHIHAALTNATGVSFDAEAGASAVQSESATVASADLLAALRHLHQNQGTAHPSGRNLVQAVIAQVEGMIKNGVAQCQITSLKEFLTRVAGEEEAFLLTVQRQIPIVTGGIQQLKFASPGAASSNADHSLMEQVAQLGSAAQQVNAATAVTFFKGLHSFVILAAQRRVEVTVQRFDAVEARLTSVAKSIQDWVEAGRQERAAIGTVLLASLK
jgi:chemotaxis protein histidine kinase CheA